MNLKERGWMGALVLLAALAGVPAAFAQPVAHSVDGSLTLKMSGHHEESADSESLAPTEAILRMQLLRPAHASTMIDAASLSVTVGLGKADDSGGGGAGWIVFGMVAVAGATAAILFLSGGNSDGSGGDKGLNIPRPPPRP